MSKRDFFLKPSTISLIFLTILIFALVTSVVISLAEEFDQVDQGNKCISRQLVPIETQSNDIACLKPEYLESP